MCLYICLNYFSDSSRFCYPYNTELDYFVELIYIDLEW